MISETMEIPDFLKPYIENCRLWGIEVNDVKYDLVNWSANMMLTFPPMPENVIVKLSAGDGA